MSSDQPYTPEWTYDKTAGAGYLRLRPDRVTSSEAAGSAPHVVDLTLTKTVGIEFYDSEDAALVDRFLARVRRDAALSTYAAAYRAGWLDGQNGSLPDPRMAYPEETP